MMIMMMLGGDIDDAFYCFGWWSRWQALATGSDSPFCPSGGLAHEEKGQMMTTKKLRDESR